MAANYINELDNRNPYHIANDKLALYEPSRSNAFVFEINKKLDTLVGAGENSKTQFTDVQETIKLSVAETFVPHFNLETIEIRHGNSVTKFAGTPTFSDGTLKINDYVGAQVKDKLLAWQALAYDINNDIIQLGPVYKMDCVLKEYAPDFSKVIRYWTLKGCWVKELSEGSFSHDSNDKRSIDVTIVYDRAIPGKADQLVYTE